MNKTRQRDIKAQFKAKFGRLPLKATSEQPSEWRSLKKAWHTYRRMPA